MEPRHELREMVVADPPLSGHHFFRAGGDETSSQAGPVSPDFTLSDSSATGGEDDEVCLSESERRDLLGKEDTFDPFSMKDETGAKTGTLIALDDKSVPGEVQGALMIFEEGKKLLAIRI